MPAIPRRARPDDTRESAIQLEIRKALKPHRDLLLFRNAQSFAEVWDENRGTTRHARGGLGVGTPDLVGVLGPAGRWFALEVKAVRGAPSPEQLAMADLMRQRGAFVAFVRSPAEALAALERARAGASE